MAETRHRASWRDLLEAAQEGVGTAYARRRRIFRLAHDTGLSLAQIGEAVGMSAGGVHKIVGKNDANGDSPGLDDPARIKRLEDLL